jgi:hypothetical protein
MTRAAKQKGRLGQNEIRDKLLEVFPEFEPDDIKSTTMGDGGEDIQLSPAARKKMPITIEVKRRKSGMKMQYDWLEQATRHGKGEPVLVFRADRSEWIVMVGLEHYMELLRGWKNV